jgi:alkylation response protein AidB-like acyl-CoA dehydrogenase
MAGRIEEAVISHERGPAARATQVARKLVTEYNIEQEVPSRETIDGVLRTFAADGLLDLGFLQDGNCSIQLGDMREATDVISALAALSGTLASIYMLNAILGPACISLAGTPEQRRELLERTRQGRLQLAFALTEPDAGSDAAGLTTTAVRDGDSFVLDGTKIYTTGAATADFIIVVARPSTDTAGKRTFDLSPPDQTA